MLESLFSNLASAPVLFFLLGALACAVKSDLDIPQPIPKFLSLYLLMSIGLKGGVALGESGFGWEVVAGVGAGVVLSFAVPVWTFFLLRSRMGVVNAAGVAATYGSISAVTFIIASSFLQQRGVAYGGHMVAAMALMESPAIIMGILLANWFRKPGEGDTGKRDIPWGKLLHEAAVNSAVFMLLGSMAVGLLIGREGFADIAPFAATPFKGMLCLFLLDMGLVASRRLNVLQQQGLSAVGFSLVAPPFHAKIGIMFAWLLRLGPGDALLLAVLAGSASYIAVPAALRLSLPKANPSIYLPMSLGLTFPFNVIAGIPLYWFVIEKLWQAGG